jgi:hypothetical protein
MSETAESTMERRRHEREVLVRPCKVRSVRSLLFTPAETTNVSVSGALVRVPRGSSFGVGDELEIAVAWDHEAVVPSHRLVRARVKRITPIDCHHQAIGVEYQAWEGRAAIAAAA